MSRSYLISAEQALKETQGDYNQQIDRLNNLIRRAIDLSLRKILVPSDMVEVRESGSLFMPTTTSLSIPEVEKELKNKGFKLFYGGGWIEVQW